jgi:tRNA modification GTPase
MATETIVAAATPPGKGGIGIVRISGPHVPDIATELLGRMPVPRVATFTPFTRQNGEIIDVGFALYFAAPHSYTGEAVLELQGHGSPITLEALITRVLELGARRAHPGEFTQRAFLNDKLDLAQAEAIVDLIEAGSQEAAQAAMRSLQGEFSNMVEALNSALINLRTYIEAALDFPDEEVDWLADPELDERLQTLRDHFTGILQSARQGKLLRDGMTVVIAGRPNAGKSSLLNRLAGYEAAIVTPLAGTTRDVLRERIAIDGMPLHILDTAGLRDSEDEVEIEGIRRAHAELQRADRILFVIDSVTDPGGRAYQEEMPRLPTHVPITLLFNKSDLSAGVPVSDTVSGPPRITISALNGQGLDTLRSHLKSCMGFNTPEAGSISARQRHIEALQSAQHCAERAAELLKERRAVELIAEELRQAQQALGKITGQFTADDLLGEIFGSFCIGK